MVKIKKNTHYWLKGYWCQHYAQVVKRLKMSIVCTSGEKVKHVNIMHKWFIQVVKHVKHNVDSPVLSFRCIDVLSNPGTLYLSSLCLEWTLLCSVCTDWRSIIVYFAHDFSPWVTYDKLLAWSTSWMPLVEQDLSYHLESLCLTPVLMRFLLLKS